MASGPYGESGIESPVGCFLHRLLRPCFGARADGSGTGSALNSATIDSALRSVAGRSAARSGGDASAERQGSQGELPRERHRPRAQGRRAQGGDSGLFRKGAARSREAHSVPHARQGAGSRRPAAASVHQTMRGGRVIRPGQIDVRGSGRRRTRPRVFPRYHCCKTECCGGDKHGAAPSLRQAPSGAEFRLSQPGCKSSMCALLWAFEGKRTVSFLQIDLAPEFDMAGDLLDKFDQRPPRLEAPWGNAMALHAGLKRSIDGVDAARCGRV